MLVQLGFHKYAAVNSNMFDIAKKAENAYKTMLKHFYNRAQSMKAGDALATRRNTIMAGKAQNALHYMQQIINKVDK